MAQAGEAILRKPKSSKRLLRTILDPACCLLISGFQVRVLKGALRTYVEALGAHAVAAPGEALRLRFDELDTAIDEWFDQQKIDA
jgi:hypothetical protein